MGISLVAINRTLNLSIGELRSRMIGGCPRVKVFNNLFFIEIYRNARRQAIYRMNKVLANREETVKV